VPVRGDPLVSSYARPKAFAEIALFARDPAGSIVLLARPERHEFGQHSEASLHQVRIEVGEEDLPADEHELDEFRGCLLEASERWARQCIADRHVEVEGV
jgi:hypothetical protein